MKIVKQSWNFEELIDPANILQKIKNAGQTCWRSDSKKTSKEFVQMLIYKGHESVLEHASITVRLITDRGMTHLIVRHRIASYSQESTQYCNYLNERFGKDIQFILPVQYYSLFNDVNQEFFLLDDLSKRAAAWKELCAQSEKVYFYMMKQGAAPQEARAILPTCVKTELVMTMNLREWRHFFKLRTSSADQLQIRELAGSLLHTFTRLLPEVFEDIKPA